MESLKRVRRAVLSAAAVALIVAGYIAGITAWNDTRHSGDPVVTSLTAWRRVTLVEDLSDWPAEGNLTGDWPLLRAAAAAYRAGEQLDPADPVYVLYAGDLPGAGTLVVLGAGDGPVDSYRPGARRPLTRLGTYPIGDDGPPFLIPLPGNRLLVPPWRSGLSMAWLDGAGVPLEWRPLTVRDGIATESTDTLPAPACVATLAAVRYRDATIGARYAFTGTVLVTTPRYDGTLGWPADVAFDQVDENVPLSVFAPLADLTCSDPEAADWLYGGGYELGITDYGQATIPSVGPVIALSLDAENADFGPVVRTGVLGGQSEFVAARPPGETLATGDGVPGVTAAWWHSPQGAWYILAAGDHDLRAFGSAGPLPVALRSGTFTVFSARRASPAAIGPVLVSAPGAAVAVLPAESG